MTKLILAFRNFSKAPEKVKFAIEQSMKAQRGSRSVALLFLQPRY
jgi:hypothetical protein